MPELLQVNGHQQTAQSGQIAKTKSPDCRQGFRSIVGVAGFEPAASTSQMWRDTGLRYTPSGAAKVRFNIFSANIF